MTETDLSAIEAERQRVRDTHLRPTGERPESTARGLHHTALISSDVERTVRTPGLPLDMTRWPREACRPVGVRFPPSDGHHLCSRETTRTDLEIPPTPGAGVGGSLPLGQRLADV